VFVRIWENCENCDLKELGFDFEVGVAAVRCVGWMDDGGGRQKRVEGRVREEGEGEGRGMGV
jgi:hypothetical protein